MFKVSTTEIFDEWLNGLDRVTRHRVIDRIDNVAVGNFGDHKSLKKGLWELKFKCHGGMRVYYIKQGKEITILLSGGSKSTQKQDIKRARLIQKEVQNV